MIWSGFLFWCCVVLDGWGGCELGGVEDCVKSRQASAPHEL